MTEWRRITKAEAADPEGTYMPTLLRMRYAAGYRWVRFGEDAIYFRKSRPKTGEGR